jgi:hypothetical protein
VAGGVDLFEVLEKDLRRALDVPPGHLLRPIFVTGADRVEDLDVLRPGDLTPGPKNAVVDPFDFGREWRHHLDQIVVRSRLGEGDMELLVEPWYTVRAVADGSSPVIDDGLK